MIVSSLTPAACAASRALSTTFFMSCGAMNCAFLMFTGLPDAATAWMKSVWRARKAGRLQHVDHLGDRRDLRNVVNVGQHRHAELVADLLEDPQPLVHSRARGSSCRDERLALSKLDLKMNRMPSLSVIRFSRLGGAQLQFLAFDDAGAGDEEEGLVEPDLRVQVVAWRAI